MDGNLSLTDFAVDPCWGRVIYQTLPSPLSPRPYRKGLGTKLLSARIRHCTCILFPSPPSSRVATPRSPPMHALPPGADHYWAPESSDQCNEGLPQLGKATSVHLPPLPAGSCVPRPCTCCGCVYVSCFPLSPSQFRLSYEKGSGSGGCSVATAEWGCRD